MGSKVDFPLCSHFELFGPTFFGRAHLGAHTSTHASYPARLAPCVRLHLAPCCSLLARIAILCLPFHMRLAPQTEPCAPTNQWCAGRQCVHRLWCSGCQCGCRLEYSSDCEDGIRAEGMCGQLCRAQKWSITIKKEGRSF